MKYHHIHNAPFIKEITELTDNLCKNGWAENHAGNVSYLLDESEVSLYLDCDNYIWEKEIGFSVPNLKNKIFLVTGAGKAFRNVSKAPSDNLAIIKINDDGTSYKLLWGLASGGVPTSEFPAHLMCHDIRLSVDSSHKVILHTHTTSIIAMTFIHDLDDKSFTRTLWKMITECIMTFPDGVAVLPWMVAGTNELGKESAIKMKESRLIVWPQHGIMSAGSSIDNAYGLIETAEKAAEIYLLIQSAKSNTYQEISDNELWLLSDRFNFTPKKDYLTPRKL